MNSSKCVIGLDDAKGMAGFNRFLTDVCGIDLRLLHEQCSGTSGRDINPFIKANFPSGLAPHKHGASTNVYVHVSSTKVRPRYS